MPDKVTKTPLQDKELDALFEAARAEAPVPSPDLVARILSDAEAQGRPVAAGSAAPRRGRLARLVEAIGGWPAAAGLAAAAVTGLAVGIATPEALDSLSGGYLSTGGIGTEDFLPSYAALLGEG